MERFRPQICTRYTFVISIRFKYCHVSFVALSFHLKILSVSAALEIRKLTKLHGLEEKIFAYAGDMTAFFHLQRKSAGSKILENRILSGTCVFG